MRLTRNFEKCALESYQDLLMVMLANTENAFLQSQQIPGVDYNFRDIVQCTTALARSDQFNEKTLTLEDVDRTKKDTRTFIDVDASSKNFKQLSNWNFEDFLKFIAFHNAHQSKHLKDTRGHSHDILYTRFGVPRSQTSSLREALTKKFGDQFDEWITEQAVSKFKGETP